MKRFHCFQFASFTVFLLGPWFMQFLKNAREGGKKKERGEREREREGEGGREVSQYIHTRPSPPKLCLPISMKTKLPVLPVLLILFLSQVTTRLESIGL